MIQTNHRSLKFYQWNRKKEALRMLVSIYSIEYIDTSMRKASFLWFIEYIDTSMRKASFYGL